MNLSRTKILAGNYHYPKHLISIGLTTHCINRIQERSVGLDWFPKKVRITKENIHSGKCFDGKNLTSIVIRLNYHNKWLFICFNPFDGGCKSMWFKKKAPN